MQPVQNLNIGGRSIASQYQFVMQGIDRAALYDLVAEDGGRMGDDPRFADVSSDLQNKAIEATLVVDKDKANALGIDAAQPALDALFRASAPRRSRRSTPPATALR